MKVTSILIPGLVAAAAAAGSVTAAGASTAQPQNPAHHLTVKAATWLEGRPDSGGNGNWATDRMYRELTITGTGPAAGGGYGYTATVEDVGGFRTDQGAYTPNQGGTYSGDKIRGQVSGWFSGKASYSFTASTLPSTAKNAGVPGSEDGAPATAEQTTSDWYEQAFPAGTTFGGAGIGNWSWTYAGPVCRTYKTVYRHHHWVKIAVYSQQHWTDSLAGGGGQLSADGNITGVC
jgi:hypothetical protein